METSAACTSASSTVPQRPSRWMPVEGEPVEVLDYPSPAPLGVIERIERDGGGVATTYWIWMLDGCRIPLEAATAPMRLSQV